MNLSNCSQILGIFKGTFFIFITILGLLISFVVGNPIVHTNEGDVEGIRLQSRNGRDYYAFKGIAYATQPTRFQAAKPPMHWDGVREAHEFGDDCIQFDLLTDTMKGSEKCLFLNVYTTQVKMFESLLPVIVYIHGGCFEMGSSKLYEAKYWMDENVILVTLNYRLGPFGFLSTGDDVIPGNLGLKDQTLALKWVQSNIEHFGGDPKSVTIMGQSAGAMAVHLHILSNYSKGLFSRAVSLSGDAVSPIYFDKNPTEKSTNLAKLLQCDISSSDSIRDCLIGKDANDILKAVKKFEKWFTFPICNFRPVSEKGTHAFLKHNPRELVQMDEIANNVTWMVGVTETEGTTLSSSIMYKEKGLEDMNLRWTEVAPVFLHFNNTPMKDLLSAKIREFYFGTQPISDSMRRQHVNLISDRVANFGVTKSITHYAEKFGEVYPYIFAYKPQENPFTFDNTIFPKGLPGWTYSGVGHWDDLVYLFNGTHGAPDYSDDDAEECRFSKKWIRLITSFVETGKPNSTVFNETCPSWERVPVPTPHSKLHWFRIDSKPVIDDDPFWSRLEFWKRLDSSLEKEMSKTQHPKDEL